jgi:putative membrane protein
MGEPIRPKPVTKKKTIMRLIIEILLMGVAVALAAYLLPGVQVSGFLSAIIAGVLIALANATIGTILRLLTFPINILTLGIMSFIITVLMVLLVDSLMSGFNTNGFFSALIFAIVLALIKMVFGMFNRS